MTMRSASLRGYGVVLAFLLTLVPLTAGAADVEDVLARMRKAIEPPSDMRADFEMTMTNKQGESLKWSGQYFRKPGPEGGVHLIFQSPIDLRGTEITARHDPEGHEHMRIYLPSLRRVRDLSGDMRGESFLGTDFNYEDIGLGRIESEENSVEEDGKVDGRACYRLVSKPTHGWWYGKVVRSIDKKTYLPLRTEYYDRSEILWKVRTLADVKTVAGHPTPTRITMETVPNGTSTTVMFTDVTYDAALSPALFQRP
jgi:outer membrane lipoprotein-sorting protein